MDEIRIAIAGAGNCASALLQGINFYKDAKEEEFVPGLMHVNLGGYHVSDIECVAAFDVDANKVGKDLAEALLASPNNTIQFAEIPKTDVTVKRGPTYDGLGEYYDETIEESEQPVCDVTKMLEESKADILVNYLPVGSEKAVKWYAMRALEAGCGMVNCMPVFIAGEKKWQKKFESAKVPIIGDDIKSQVGATIVHRVLTKLFNDRGVKLDRTYQLNVGGNMDFKNMLEEKRLISKRVSKTNAVTSQLDHEVDPDDVYIGPSDYIPWLTDRKFGFLRMEGTEFGNVPINIELKLEVWDSPNSAGVAIDAIRCCKLGLDRGIGGALTEPSAYFMKSPPIQYSDSKAKELVDSFIKGK